MFLNPRSVDEGLVEAKYLESKGLKKVNQVDRSRRNNGTLIRMRRRSIKEEMIKI